MQIRGLHRKHPVEVVPERLLADVRRPSCSCNIILASDVATVAPIPSGVADLLAGPQRLGRFELLNQVGLGGFGAV